MTEKGELDEYSLYYIALTAAKLTQIWRTQVFRATSFGNHSLQEQTGNHAQAQGLPVELTQHCPYNEKQLCLSKFYSQQMCLIKNQ